MSGALECHVVLPLNASKSVRAAPHKGASRDGSRSLHPLMLLDPDVAQITTANALALAHASD